MDREFIKQNTEPIKHEPFVPAHIAATYVGVKRRFLLSLARQGIAGAYPLGTGLRQRNTWVFLLSELTEAIRRNGLSLRRRPPQREPSYDLNIRQSPLK
jgi:hypothetical protein